MTTRQILILAALALAASVSGCGIPQDGRYQTHGGGWDNFRAEAPQGLMVGTA